MIYLKIMKINFSKNGSVAFHMSREEFDVLSDFLMRPSIKDYFLDYCSFYGVLDTGEAFIDAIDEVYLPF